MREEIKNYLVKMRQKKQRARTIFLSLRELSKFESFSDLLLLNSIVNCLIELNLPYGRKEIYSAFKEVDKFDYDISQKRELLKFLLRKAENKSIFQD